jgi:hypothetical protein
MTSCLFSWCYILLLTQCFFWCKCNHRVMATFVCVAQKAASAAQEVCLNSRPRQRQSPFWAVPKSRPVFFICYGDKIMVPDPKFIFYDEISDHGEIRWFEGNLSMQNVMKFCHYQYLLIWLEVTRSVPNVVAGSGSTLVRVSEFGSGFKIWIQICRPLIW